MTSTLRRLAMLVALAMGLSLALAPAVAAHDGHDTDDLPARIDLPDGWQPEGIESWGKWLYAGSLANGAIWRANARTGEGQILVPGQTGKVAVGLHIDHWGRLWVAGGPTGEVRVYNARNGKLLQTYTFTGTGFLNDLDIARNARLRHRLDEPPPGGHPVAQPWSTAGSLEGASDAAEGRLQARARLQPERHREPRWLARSRSSRGPGSCSGSTRGAVSRSGSTPVATS